MTFQLQRFLDETEYLDPFQSGFMSGYWTETVLVTLLDGLLWELDRGYVSLMVLLDLSVDFYTIDHSILLIHLSGMGLGATVSCWHQPLLEEKTQRWC